MEPQNALARGRGLIAAGRYAEAARALQQAAYHRPDWPDVHHQLALALSLAGEPLRAESHLQRALDLNPDYAEAHLNLAILLFERGAYHAAREHLRAFDRLVRREGESLPEAALDDLARRHAALGQRYHEYGLLEEAETQLRQALRLCPAYSDLRLQLARVLLERDALDDAAENLEQVLQTRPDWGEALLLSGRIALGQGKPEAARAAWQRVQEGPEGVQARALLEQLRGVAPAARIDPVDRAEWKSWEAP
jgi:tetratricopeptide (TPR) repeat protein